MNPTVRSLYESHDGLLSDKWSSYLEVYEETFSSFREKPIRLLEIGVQNGGSLQIWRKYFPNARVIVGCDIDPRISKLQPGSGIRLVIGDISAPSTIQCLKDISPNFDIIIDDGSHRSEHVIAAFQQLFSLIAPGGIFFAEDIHCSYWDGYNGRVLGSFSSIEFFKRLVDAINLDHWRGRRKERLIALLKNYFQLRALERMPLNELHAQVRSVRFYNSICVVERTQGEIGLGQRIASGNVTPITDAIFKIPHIRYGGGTAKSALAEENCKTRRGTE